MKRNIILAAICIAVLHSFVACDNETIINIEPGLPSAGECQPACAENEECVDGSCQEVALVDSCNNACTETQTCVDGKCVENADCPQGCSDTQTCVDGKCIENAECPLGCADDEECQDGECVRIQKKCLEPCSDDMFCYNGECISNNRLCLDKICEDNFICVGQVCTDINEVDSCLNRCKNETTCVEGNCVENYRICNEKVCQTNELCINGKCVIRDECNNVCDNEQTCFHGACVDKDSICNDKVCQVTEKCISGTCYDEEELCNGTPCQDKEVCINNACVVSCDFTGCKVDETCFEHVCKPKIDPNGCDGKCSKDEVCYENVCISATRVCGSAVCPEGRVCDASGEYCSMPCDDGTIPCWGSCCMTGFSCDKTLMHCTKDCTETQTSCYDGWLCCDQGTACNEDYCLIQCASNQVRCGARGAEVCCLAGHVCENEVCKIPCSNGTRCGANEEYCCTGNNVCLFNACHAKGKTCASTNDCELDEYCDTGYNMCVKVSDDPNACIYKPPVASFSPKVKWQSSGVKGAYFASVVNLTDDNGDGKINENDIPDVVVVSNDKYLYALSGDDGRILAKHPSAIFNLDDDMGAADIDNDGKIEVVVGTTSPAADAKIYAMNLNKKNNNTYEWVVKKSISIPTGWITNSGSNYWVDAHPQFADLDQDGHPEVITSFGVLSGEGDWSKWKCNYTLPRIYVWYSYMPVVADLDQDGKSEIIADRVFDLNCNVIIPAAESGWYYPAIADMLPDSADAKQTGELVPEIVRVRDGRVSVWKVYKKDGKWSQKKIWDKYVAGSNGGGNPNIGDVNGDGKPDIGVAGYDYYTVLNGQTGAVIWADKDVEDHSSERTGSSIFDFEGDGKAEVIYRDELYIRIYRGAGSGVDSDNDGFNNATVLWKSSSKSGTVIEYPIIVDVDNDGRTEIVMVNNSGVTVYADTNDNWVRTRRIWNQHAYHVTNINEDGTVPRVEKANWLVPRYNNYRMNVQPEGGFSAPNFVPTKLEANYDKCDKGIVRLTATIENKGSISSGKGMNVAFYINDYGASKQKVWIGEAQITDAIIPGSSKTVSIDWDMSGKLLPGKTNVSVSLPQKIYVEADTPYFDTSISYMAFNECIEGDNTLTPTSIAACQSAN